jgi:hypothetical protein
MATFYQGDQLVQVVSIDGTYNDLDFGEYPVIYTVPTGYYGLLKFAHVGSLTNYPTGTAGANIWLVSKYGAIPNNTGGALGVAGNYNYLKSKLLYKPNISVNLNNSDDEDTYPNQITFYDYYLRSGDRFYLAVFFTGNQNVRYELEIHLYKKP